MTTHFAQSGQKVKILARDFNRWQQTADQVLGMQNSLGANQIPVTAKQSDTIDALNITGSDLEVGEPVLINSPLTLPTENLDEFKFNTAVTIGKADKDYHFAITAEPIPANQIGKICISGLAVAKLNDNAQVGDFLEINDSGKLVKTQENSQAKVIWSSQASSSSVQNWALVLLGNKSNSLTKFAKILEVKTDDSCGIYFTANPCDKNGANIKSDITLKLYARDDKTNKLIRVENNEDDIVTYLPIEKDAGILVATESVLANGFADILADDAHNNFMPSTFWQCEQNSNSVQFEIITDSVIRRYFDQNGRLVIQLVLTKRDIHVNQAGRIVKVGEPVIKYDAAIDIAVNSQNSSSSSHS